MTSWPPFGKASEAPAVAGVAAVDGTADEAADVADVVADVAVVDAAAAVEVAPASVVSEAENACLSLLEQARPGVTTSAPRASDRLTKERRDTASNLEWALDMAGSLAVAPKRHSKQG